MIGNSLNDLSKFYSGNSLSHKSLRVSHLEKSENCSERVCHSNGPNSLHQKNITDKKLDMPNIKKTTDDNNTKVPSSTSFLNTSHQSKKILDTLNDKNMCHYIFQQHLNLKSQTPYEKVDTKPKDKNTIKAGTSNLKHRENFYKTHSPYHYSNLLGKIQTESPIQMKMPPPTVHTNIPSIPSPPGSFGAKQLSKLKRFLTTLQQFAVDISPETGERVRGLVLNLVNSVISIEEFHSKLQEATNFPLRPFVIPFLRANLPLLQYELMNFTRLSKLNASDYLNQSVENFLFNDNSTHNSLSPPHFHGPDSINNKLKRKSPDNETIIPPPSKKVAQNLPLLYISSPNSHYSGSIQNQGLTAPPPIRPRPSPPHQHIPQIPIQPPSGVHYPVPNIPKQTYPNHLPNYMNSHIPNPSSPKNFYPVPNTLYPNREGQFHHSSNGSTNSPFNPTGSQFGQLHINPGNNIPNQAGLLITNQMNGKNSAKQDDYFLKGKDKSFNNYMKEFEHDFNEALNLDTVNIDFKNIDSMLNSIFEMVEKTQKILDNVHSKAQKIKSQKEFYESELKRIAESNSDQIKKSSDLISLKNDQRISDHFNKEREKCVSHLNQDENISEKCWNCGRRGIETCTKCNQTKFCSNFCKNKHYEVKHYLDNVKIEKLDEKENEIINDLNLNSDIINSQENHSTEENENDSKNDTTQNENKEIKD